MPNLRKKPDRQPPALSRLFFSFLRLGTTAFGGPAMIAYIRELAVEREQWLRPKTFQEGMALCQTIPGATAMQVATYVGLRVRGVRGYHQLPGFRPARHSDHPPGPAYPLGLAPPAFRRGSLRRHARKN